MRINSPMKRYITYGPEKGRFCPHGVWAWHGGTWNFLVHQPGSAPNPIFLVLIWRFHFISMVGGSLAIGFVQPLALHLPQNQRMELKVSNLYSRLVPLAATHISRCFPKVTSLAKDKIQGLEEFCARNEDKDQIYTISQPAISGHPLSGPSVTSHCLFLCI